MKFILLVSSIVVAMAGCSGSGSDSIIADDDQSGGGQNNARYRLTFNATWSADTHSLRFPDNPHFSPLVGAVHNEQVEFWKAGQNSSDGMEDMAETGATGALLSEVDQAISNGAASLAVAGGGIQNSPDSVSVEFEVSRDYPQLTLVSMLAPSPDWFVGVGNLSLLQNGAFVANLTIDLPLYDAGTDSGARYTSADLDTEVADPIRLLYSFPDDSPFQDGQPFVGQFVIEKL